MGRPKQNNSLGSGNQPTPMPRDYTGGSEDFAVIRQIDGHVPNRTGLAGQNAHYPNHDEDDWEVAYDDLDAGTT